MKARVQRILRRLGPAGIVGIGVLLACAGFWISGLAPLEQELAARRMALGQLRARAPYQPVSADGRAEDLRRFHSLFPPAAAMTDELERVHRMARGAGLELAQGEYRLERRPAGLWSYRVALPVTGTYGQLRDFVAKVLKDAPTVSIDALRFERQRAAQTQLQAQVRLTLYLRPPGETP
ncbi:MAG TPA: type 4a pilus biogenesis protein PilO [Burkholderiales bacterium]|nr:type 4a pilus biogenesis protein PilO [Burkholderiales bacterium]